MPKASITEQTTDPSRARYKVRWRESDGSARSQSCTTRKAAERKVRDLANADDDGSHIDDRAGRMTVAAFAETCPEEHWIDLGPGTLDRYGVVLRNQILPTFGDRRLVDVETSDVRAWIANLRRKGLSAATIRKSYYVLARLFADAVVDRKLRVSPCSGVKLPPIANAVPETVDRVELGKLALALPDDYRAIAFVMGSAGLRIGEALALRWRDLDLDSDRPTITVRGSLSVSGGKVSTSSTKTRSGVRGVPLLRDCAEALRELRDRKDPGSRDLVFPDSIGGPFRPENFRRRVFAPAVDAVGLSITPHALRHSALTLWLEAGATPMLAAAWAGHADKGALIVRTYGHVRAAHADQIVDALNDDA